MVSIVLFHYGLVQPSRIQQLYVLLFQIKMPLTLTLEFSGGAELLVDKQKKHDVTIESDKGKFTIQVILRLNLGVLEIRVFEKRTFFFFFFFF